MMTFGLSAWGLPMDPVVITSLGPAKTTAIGAMTGQWVRETWPPRANNASFWRARGLSDASRAGPGRRS